MRSEGEIRSDIYRELAAKERYLKDYPSGHDGAGGFYCGTSLNLLYAELAQVMGVSDPEDVKKDFATGARPCLKPNGSVCKHKNRTMDGGCPDCGDPSL